MDFWCAEQIVVTVDGPASRTVVSVAQPFARVGSHPDAEVVIPDPAVARRCLYLHALPSGVFCLFLDIAPADVVSQGSQHNGMWLQPEQDVTVGAYRIRACLLSADEGAALPKENLAAWGSAPAPLPVLMVHCGGLLKDKRRFRARLSPLGRRPQCGLQLRGKKVSSFHCVLYWDREQLWCIDLNSSNGTTLNGETIGCTRVGIGDRLDVGEFGLVFQRLSSGGSQPKLSDGGRESKDRAANRAEHSLPPQAIPHESPASDDDQNESSPHPLVPTMLAASAVVAGPTVEQLARLEVERKLREQLTEEAARLGRERQEMQSRWDQASQLLQAQISQLQDEARRLASERKALEASRGQWSEERAALTSQLGERSDELARLQSELTAARSSFAEKLAEEEQRSELARVRQQSREELTYETAPLPDDVLACEFAPTTIVEGFSDELPDGLAGSPDRVQQVLPDLDFDYASAQPQDAPQAGAARAVADPAEQLQAQWEATSQRLTVQIEQLQAESAELSAQRQALEKSRQDWQVERQTLTEQLTARTERLSQLEADLAVATAALAKRLAEAEQQTQVAAHAPAGLTDGSLTLQESAGRIDELLQAQIAPATVVAGLETDVDARLAAIPEVSWSYTPIDPTENAPPVPDPQLEMQARWEVTNEQLSAQVEQFRAEATQLAAERLVLAQARDEWRVERDSLTGQLAERQQELSRQQAELSTATSSLAAKLSDVEHRLIQPPTNSQPGPPPPPVQKRPADEPQWAEPEFQFEAPAAPLEEPKSELRLQRISLLPPPLELDPLPSASSAPDTLAEWDAGDISIAADDAAETPPLHDASAVDPDELDEMKLLVSERIGKKEEPRALRWLWWSAGGIGVAALVAVIVIVVLWAF